MARGRLNQKRLSICLLVNEKSRSVRFCVHALPGTFLFLETRVTHTRLPETPLASYDDPEAEEKVGDGVGQDARRQAFRPIRDAIVERARNEGRDPVRRRMVKPEPNGHDREGEPGKRSKWDSVEFFVKKIAKQESAPEDFLDQWNDNDQPQKTEDDRGPVRGWLAGKDLGIEAVETRRETEQSLRRNP